MALQKQPLQAGEQVVDLGPPFAGMLAAVEPGQPEIVAAVNLLFRRGTIETTPAPVTLALPLGLTPCHYGFWGERQEDGRVVYLVLGEQAGHVSLSVFANGSVQEVYDLTDLYGETADVGDHYSFATLQRSVYFCKGQWVFEVDRDSLALSVVTLEPNPDPGATDIPYMTGRISARQVESHLGSLWYVVPRRGMMTTSLTLSASDPALPDKTRIVAGGCEVRPTDILSSDVWAPRSVRAGWAGSVWAVDGDGSPIQAIKSWNRQLLIWTRNAVYSLTGSDPDPSQGDMALECLRRGAGCSAPASVACVGEYVFWQGFGAVYRMAPDGSITAIEATTPLWGDAGRLAEGLVRTVPGPWRERAHEVIWQASEAGQGCSYCGSHYFLTGQSGLLVVEAETGAVSMGSSQVFGAWEYTIGGNDAPVGAVICFAAWPTPLLVAPGHPPLQTEYQQFPPLLLFRVSFPPFRQMAATGLGVRLSDIAATAEWSVVALDDAFRIGADPHHSVPDKGREVDGATTVEGGVAEECGIFDSGDSRYDGTPGIPSFPRWSPTTPVTYHQRTGRSVTGTDFLVRIEPRSPVFTRVERVSLIVAETGRAAR